jgi:hypothetical protein
LWVQENVSSDAVEILHCVSKDWNEKHTDSDGRMENRFSTLQGMDKKKKDGKEIQMEYNYDDRQISKIRYVPEKIIKTSQGKDKILTERWRGLIRGIDRGPDKFVWLEWEWVQKELSEEFIGFIKSTRQSGTEGYVRIPEGLAEDQTQQMLKIKPQHDAPVLKYKRCGTIEETDPSCVLKSAASALSYFGYMIAWHFNCVMT